MQRSGRIQIAEEDAPRASPRLRTSTTAVSELCSRSARPITTSSGSHTRRPWSNSRKAIRVRPSAAAVSSTYAAGSGNPTRPDRHRPRRWSSGPGRRIAYGGVEDIPSAPLLALLDGLTTEGVWADWAGRDRYMDGFMSSATRSLSFTTPLAAKPEQNLAIVSGQYLNLSLKLGSGLQHRRLLPDTDTQRQLHLLSLRRRRHWYGPSSQDVQPS